ncbi:MAG TPA: SDR family oxidoreductase [Candidatus Eisenbacteria bacterium]
MIVVTGAAGQTGSEVVRLLSAKGLRVRALVRDPSKAKGIGGPAVEIVTGDLAKPLSLDPVFRGADKIFLVSSPDLEIATLHGNAIDAAKRAGVRQIVRLSVYGSSASSPAGLLRAHGEADDRLSRSGLSFTILRPNAFYQNTLAFADSIASQGTIFAPARDGAVSMIDCRDVAIAAAAVLTGGTHSGRLYDLTGPRAIGYAEIAAMIGAAIGSPVTYVDVPPDAAREAMIGMGMPAWLAEALVELYAVWGSGKSADVTDAFERIAGKNPRPFEEFAKDYAASSAGLVPAGGTRFGSRRQTRYE